MRTLLSLFISLTLFVPAIHAEQKHKNKKQDGAIIFHPADRRVISNYFLDTRNLPPGLAKRNGNLPPGLQRQLHRNGQLPPGLQKRLTAFPDDLNRQLLPLPGTYRRGMIGDNAVIYDPTTNTILDVINIFSSAR